MSRIKIENALIYDGLGNKPYKSELVIANERIDCICEKIDGDFDRVIDAKNKIVTPGFIDVHRHCDSAALSDPAFGKIELCQGISTVVSGNCGMSLAPSSDFSRAQMYRFLEPCLGEIPPDYRFWEFKDYKRALQKRDLPVCMETMVGTGAVRIAVKGFDSTPYTKEELKRAKYLLEASLEQGACAVSTGIMYTPECYTDREEWLQLLSVLKGKNKILTCHIRGEGDGLVESVREVIDWSQTLNIPVNISHFKSVGIKNWGQSIYRAVDLIEKSSADISVDFYPYDGGATTLLSLLPPDISSKYGNRIYEALGTSEGVDELRLSLKKSRTDWDNMIEAIGYERILISSTALAQDRWMCGKNLKMITEEGGYSDEVACICDLLCRNQGVVGIIVLSMSQSDIDYIAGLPFSSVISDSLYTVTEHPHPRLYGSFSKIIEDYVLKRKILTMEEAVHKMSKKPAERFRLEYVGQIKEGFYANINIFDPNKIRSAADYQNPKQLSGGMETVFVRGKEKRQIGEL